MLKKMLSAALSAVMFLSMFSALTLQSAAVEIPTVNIKISHTDYTPISGPRAGENEGYEKLFDNSLVSKGLFKGDNITTPIVWKTADVRTVTEYNLCGGADSGQFKDRYPKSWTLYGSMTGGANWYVLDSHTADISEFVNLAYAGNYFDVDTPAPALFYKLEVNSIYASAANDCYQLSEIQMFESREAETYSNQKLNPADVTATNYGTAKGPITSAFDGDETTKTGIYGLSASWNSDIVWKTDAPVTATYYTIMSGFDSAQNNNRYLKDWSFNGSVDGENWVELDAQKDYIFAKANSRNHTFAIAHPGTYQYFKIHVTGTRGAFQSNEIKLHYPPDYQNIQAAERVEALIDALPDPITWKDREQVGEARKAYEALTEEQKALVPNLSILKAAEDVLASGSNQLQADEIIALIDKGDFAAARAAYDAVPSDVQALVTNYHLLAAHEIPFSTSFEFGDGLELLENTPDAHRTSENVSGETGYGIRGNVTALVDPASIEGTGNLSNEGMQQLFDGSISTKFLYAFQDGSTRPSEDTPIWVRFRLKDPKIVRSYSLCAGNDAPERDPVDWTLYGSADGENWISLDARKDQNFYERYQENLYTFKNETAYAYYKLEITRNDSSTMTQLSELKLGTGEGEIESSGQSGFQGNVTALLQKDSITGSQDGNTKEIKKNLFDGKTATKWFCNLKPTESDPVWASFQMKEALAVNTYAVGAANDFPERDPKSWNLQASVDGSTWITLDSRTNQSFSNRYEVKVYTFENQASYARYRLNITDNNGGSTTQLSELKVGTAPSSTEPGEDSAMLTWRADGPAESWINSTGSGWSGLNSLYVAGAHQGAGRAHASNVIYDNLNIPVVESTKLCYMIFPAQPRMNYYDFDHTSEYLAVDLRFTDGTYLSDLRAVDQNGNRLTPQAQGDSETLFTMQWNQVASQIGQVAAGRTIEQILIVYDKAQSAQPLASFLTYFDDIVISNKIETTNEHLSDYVNILRGTNDSADFSRGYATPAVAMPNGSNFYVPVTNPNSSSHYTYQPGEALSLAHIDVTHLSTPRGTSYGSWQFMPNTSLDPAAVAAGSQINGASRKAPFQHENEQAHAHYYRVQFDRDKNSPASGVRMEVTPAQHSMMARITFPTDAAFNNMIFDCSFASGGLTFGADRKSFTAFSNQVKSGSSRMYVYGEFSTEFDAAKVLSTKQGIVSFPDDQTSVTMKLATSFISEEQARRNLELEIPAAATFDSVYGQAQKTWDDLLGTIEIEGATDEQMTTFYSNLYRTYLYPNLYSENAGTNEQPDWKYASLHTSTLDGKDVKDGKVYTGNGFWDTFRTTWPAYAFLTPSQSGEMLDGMLTLYEENGWLPHFLNPGNIDTDTGSQAEAILADAAVKGVAFDYETAYQAVIKSANAVQTDNYALGGRKGQEEYPFRGYVADTSSGNSVSGNEAASWSLDNYMDDYAASQLAAALGKTEEAEYLKNRSLQFAQIFSEEAGGFFMYKNLGGVFTNAAGLDPHRWLGAYCESNAWNTLFTVPHDVNGLANLSGGREALAEKLDAFFGADLDLHRIPTLHEMREAREIRMGLLAFNTQPSLQIPYLYDYVGQPYKTQALVREIMDRLYVGGGVGQGYVGDDDAGSLSAWYVFSALGFFPTAVGNPEYTIGSPLFKKATVHLENGQDLVVNAPENSKEKVYVQSVKLNGQIYDKTFFAHEDLMKGGVIDFEMGAEPSDWGTGADAAPTSVTQGDEIQLAKRDLTQPTMQKRSGVNLSLGEPIFMTDNTDERSKLIDNTSATETALVGSDKEIWYYTPNPQVVSMYTLTSGADPSSAPSSFALYGSKDGEKWIQLDERTGETFAYNQFTRPFSVDEKNRQAYSYFKLEFDGREDLSLAEIELLGSDTYTTVMDTIEALPDKAGLDISHKRAVANAREMYSILPPEDKAQVANRDKLEETVARMQTLVGAQPVLTEGFAQEVAAIADRYDSSQRQHEIVFYGASNFRMWEEMETDLSDYKVQNHGFGGSSDKDLVKFAETALYPYQPEILLFQTGSNDYVGLSGTEDEVVATCMAYKKYMFEMFHERMPHTKFVVMSGLLLPGRSQYTALTQRINAALKEYCESVDYMYFVDASSLTYDGKRFDNSLFISDGIHLNHEGQLRWCNEYIRPQIDEIAEEFDLYWLYTEDERQPDAPAGLTGVAPTLKGGQDGKITGISADMEWRAADQSGYTACSGNELTGLAAGAYTLRYRAVGGKLPSESVDITVPEGGDKLPRPDCRWTLDTQAGIVKDIRAGTTVEELIQGFGGSEWVTVTLKGKTVTTGLVTTGMTVQYSDGDREGYTTAVQGDLDGDGIVSISDVMEACKVIARKVAGSSPTPMELAVGNLDMDKAITIADVMGLCKILAGKA